MEKKTTKKGTIKHKLKKETYQGNEKESNSRRNGFKLTFFKSKLKLTCQRREEKPSLHKEKS